MYKLLEESYSKVSIDLNEDKEWQSLNSINQNWEKDKNFKNYHKLGNKQKGSNGEFFVSKIFEEAGCDVTPPSNTGHDRIINDTKIEIKFSLAVSQKDRIVKDKFIINHVSKSKDWDWLVFCGINPDPSWGNMLTRKNDNLPYGRIRMYAMEKQGFINYMNSEGVKVFKHQQAGKKGENDDFICTDFHSLINLPFVKHIDQFSWSK